MRSTAADTVGEGAIVLDAPIGVADRRLVVYTTAAATSDRLAATGTLRFRIPLIKQAMTATGGKLTLIASRGRNLRTLDDQRLQLRHRRLAW